jgi:hypothetical protein
MSRQFGRWKLVLTASGLGREREEEKRKEKKKRKSQGMRLEGYLLRRPFKNIGKRTESHTSLRLRFQILRGYSLCFFAIFPLFQKSKNGLKMDEKLI